MKRKLDFVTNSSSCAFIFIGWIIDPGDKTIEVVKENMELFGTKEYDSELRPYENLNEVYDGKVDMILGDGENGLPDNQLCIGMSKTIHDDDYETNIYSINDLLELDNKLLDCFNTDDIKIISGQELC